MEIHLEIIEASIIEEYAQYLILHPFPWISVPDDPVLILGGEEMTVAHRHRRRRDEEEEEDVESNDDEEGDGDGDEDGDGDGNDGGDEGGEGLMFEVRDFMVPHKR